MWATLRTIQRRCRPPGTAAPHVTRRPGVADEKPPTSAPSPGLYQVLPDPLPASMTGHGSVQVAGVAVVGPGTRARRLRRDGSRTPREWHGRRRGRLRREPRRRRRELMPATRRRTNPADPRLPGGARDRHSIAKGGTGPGPREHCVRRRRERVSVPARARVTPAPAPRTPARPPPPPSPRAPVAATSNRPADTPGARARSSSPAHPRAAPQSASSGRRPSLSTT